MLGDKIKARRKEMGMTQEDLAKKIGYKDKSAICLIENGKRDISQTTLRKFAEVLNVDINYFFDYQPSEKQKAVLDKLQTANEEDIDTIIKMIDVILNK